MEEQVWRQGIVVEAGSRKQPRAGSSPDSSGPASCLHTHPVCSASGHLLLPLLRDGSSVVPLSSVPEPAPSHLEVLAFKEWRQERWGQETV